jgi:hypothetical protein
MCEKYGWNDPQRALYTDPKDGKSYCLFHAPADQKKMSVDNFNLRVGQRIKRINDLNNKEITCDLRGTIFPGEISFSGVILPQISFESARFTERVFFEEATFNRPLKKSIFPVFTPKTCSPQQLA